MNEIIKKTLNLSKNMDLTAKVAVITGGGTGIGKATALLLAKQGAKVATLDRNIENGEQTVTEIAKQGGEAIAIATDVSKPEDVDAAFQTIREKYGRVDIVFINAGINGVWASIEDLSPEDWDKTLSVNLKGSFLTLKYAVPLLKRQGGSVIVNSSVNGTRIFSNTGATAYACSKAAQVAFAKMMAVELGKHKIRVNAICPGQIDTEINEKTEKKDLEEIKIPVDFPEGRIPLTGMTPGTPDQVAQVVLFLASDASSHISGTQIWIDGAESLLQG